jgi:hypothetical protein
LTAQPPSKKRESFLRTWVQIMVGVTVVTAVSSFFRRGASEAGLGLIIQLAFVFAVASLIWGINRGFRWGIGRVGRAVTTPLAAALAGAVVGVSCWGASSVAFFWALDAWMSSDGFS